MAATTSKPVVILRKKSPLSQPVVTPQQTAWVEHPKLTKVEVKAKPAPAKPVPQKPKAEAKKPVLPPTPRPADGMNTRQRRNARKRQEFLDSPEFKQIAEAMVSRWPGIFQVDPEGVRPLAIGILDDLCTALPEFKPLHLSQTLRQWMHEHRLAYWNVLIKGGPRYDLHGNEKGEVTAEQQAIALQQRKAWFDRREERRQERAKQKGTHNHALATLTADKESREGA